MSPFHCLVQPRRVDIHKVPAKAFAGASVLFVLLCFCLGGRGRALELVPAGLQVLTSACLVPVVPNGVSDAFS